MMAGVTFFVSYQVKPECVDELLELLSGLQKNAPNLPGCSGMRIFRSHDAPERFTLVEEWDDRESHQKNFERLQAEGVWEKVQAMFASAPEAYYADEV